jgi:hypothetical protein
MHSENPKISHFQWVTKLNFGGAPNFERSEKNAHVDQRLVPFLPALAKIRAKSPWAVSRSK